MKLQLLFGLWLSAIVSCSGSGNTEPEAARPEPTNQVQPQSSADIESTSAHEIEPCAPGYAAPFTPSRAQVAALRRALTFHNEGQFETAIAAFESVLEDAPDYTAARFDLACALAKAGKEDESLKAMRQVFCEDLPTNLPRALEDDDLAPLRDALREEGQRWVARYEASTENAMALVGYGNTELHHRMRY